MLPFILAFVLTNGVFLPNELYLSNADEFTGSYKSFLAIMVIGSLIVVLLAVLIELLFLPKGVSYFVNLILAGFSVLGYLQYIILNGKLESLTGDKQEWTIGIMTFNGIVWLLFIGFLVFIGYFRKSSIKFVRAVCIYIVLVQLFSGMYLAVTADIDSEKTKTAMTTKNSLEVAGNKNVLIFVLDRFDSEWMQELFEEDTDFFEPLSDFTFYNNATSLFTCTYAAVPYLLYGTEWSDEYKCGNDYLDAVGVNNNLLMSIKDLGYDLGIYTDVTYVGSNRDGYISNYGEELDIKYKPLAAYCTMWKTSMYKTLPFCLKNIFAYYSDDINDIVDNTDVWDTENDYPFYERLVKTGLSVSDEYDSAFRFYHMHGAHTPYILSSDLKYEKNGNEISRDDQIKGCLKIVYEYIEQLKELGIYDNSAIIITADHGKGNQNTGKEITVTSSPVIAVKIPNSHGDIMEVSSAPVTQAELISTIAQEAGVDNRQYGKTLEQVTQDDNSERYYIETYANQFQEWTKYIISGNVHDINNWSIAE
jgi:hypothetical protein